MHKESKKMKQITIVAIVFLMFSGHALLAQKSEVNQEKSTIKWEGKKIGTNHHGEIQLKSGYLEVQNNEITDGVFVVDMTTISNIDLENENMNQKLVGHLKSEDFFGVEKYPTSTLQVTESSKFVNGKATITGNITIKGKTEPVSFEVVRNNNEFSAKILIDRSKFDVRYGSNSFFDNLGDRAIDNIFTLEVQLVLK
jgi:polyisoprenoid-binding protein YceI